MMSVFWVILMSLGIWAGVTILEVRYLRKRAKQEYLKIQERRKSSFR